PSEKSSELSSVIPRSLLRGASFRRNRHPAVAPFGFQIRHRFFPQNHLSILILDLEKAITRNVREVVGDTLHPLRRPDEFYHDLRRAADHGLELLPHIGRPSLRRAEPSASTHELAGTQTNMLAGPRSREGLC